MTSYNLGQVILKSKPFVHALSTKERGKLCDECFKSCEKLLRCSACKLARYCNTQCQKSAWNLHKWECQCLMRVSPRVPTDSVRLMYRLIVKLQKYNGSEDKEEVFGEERCFKHLMSHSEDIRRDEVRTSAFLELTQTLTMYAGRSVEMPHPTDLLEMFGKMIINSFSICDGEMRPVGVGVYLGASKFDHSCTPNAVIVFNGTEAIVRCVQPVPVPGDISQISISYINQLALTEDRQRQLESQYYFTCQCQKCLNCTLDGQILCFKCPSLNCTAGVEEDAEGEVLPCPSCRRTTYPDTYCEERRTVAEKLRSVVESCKELSKRGEYSLILEECESLVEEYQDISHTHNYYVIQIYDVMFDACVMLNLWEKAHVYGMCTLDGFRLYYQEYHPMLGVVQLKLAKILLFLQQLDKTITSLNKAESILCVTHGTDHPLYIELQDLITQCKEQLRGHLT